MLPRCRTLLFSLLFTVLLLAGCRAESLETAAPLETTAPTRSPEPTATPEPEPSIQLEPCQVQGLQAECGVLPVFEDRTSRRGRTIDIHVAVFRARSEPVEPDPIFFLAGGPGRSAIDAAYGVVRYTFNALNQNRDVVLVDPRGAGRSNPLVCPEMQPGETSAEHTERCLAELPGDPRFYTTALAVDDLDDVRRALGYDQINLYGISYGVTALQVYLNRHGEHVRAAVLDHGTLLDVPFQDVLARNSQQALETVFARCQTEEACRAAYPDLPGDFQAALETLEDLTEPIETGVPHPVDGQPIRLTRNDFNHIVHNLMLYAGNTARLPYVIYQAAAGNWDPAALALADQIAAAPEGADRMVMPTVILCFEDWHYGSEEAMLRLGEGSYYRQTAVDDWRARQPVCDRLPEPDPSIHHGPALPSEAPMLVLVAGSDPQNPLENMPGIDRLWPNSTVVVQPGLGHSYDSHICWTTLITEFIRAGGGERLDLSCVEDFEPPPFEVK